MVTNTAALFAEMIEQMSCDISTANCNAIISIEYELTNSTDYLNVSGSIRISENREWRELGVFDSVKSLVDEYIRLITTSVTQHN